MRFIAKMESKSLAVTINARSACCSGEAKPAADHVAEHVENDDVGVFEQTVLFEQLDGLADDIAAAARAGRRPAGLDAHDARVAGCDKVLDPQLLAMELHRLRARRSPSARDAWSA